MELAYPGVLRGRLREMDPKLYSHLERSWDIALNTWLQALGMNLGSTNSYSHLRNVEGHLDRIVVEFESLPGSHFRAPLTAGEIYMLLAAVLFHDIGRIWDNAGSSGKTGHRSTSKKHAELSGGIICGNHAELGIPGRHVANALGEICRFHDVSGKERRQMLKAGLTKTVIDPCGVVREPLIAALLTLADTMDSAYTRVLPLYLSRPTGGGIVALFRQAIRAVEVDATARMIRTVVTADQEESVLKGTFTLKLGNRAESQLSSKGVKTVKKVLGIGKKSAPCMKRHGSGPVSQNRNCSRCKRHKTTATAVRECLKNVLRSSDEGKRLLAKSRRSASRLLCLLLAQDVFRLARIDRTRVDVKWELARCVAFNKLPKGLSRAIALNNMHENCQVLRDVQEVLSASGIHLGGWLIDDGEQLRTVEDEETYEPALSKEFLLRVARGMWDLSTQVFAVRQFSYGDMESQVGEPDTERVKLATRRIAICTRDCHPNDTDPAETRGPIWAGTSRWEWRTEHNDGCPPCKFVTLKEVEEAINKLVAPHANQGA